MAKKQIKTKVKSKLKKNKAVARSNKNEWPSKRNVFFRPNRMQYVRKLLKTTGCVFCLSAQDKMSFETLCVFKSKFSQVVLNKFPYNNGHLLVLPLRHGGNILELSNEEYSDLNETLRLAIAAIQQIYSPAGFNVGMNHGSSAGAGIPDHLHYHIVPRWSGDLNFFPLIAETKLVIENLDTSYEKFVDFFSKQKAKS